MAAARSHHHRPSARHGDRVAWPPRVRSPRRRSTAHRLRASPSPAMLDPSPTVDEEPEARGGSARPLRRSSGGRGPRPNHRLSWLAIFSHRHRNRRPEAVRLLPLVHPKPPALVEPPGYAAVLRQVSMAVRYTGR
ncbi:hypothetical protein Dimus_039150 [Dionaea muscipula]